VGSQLADFDEVMALIARLPHAGRIAEADAARWTRRTLAMDPERIRWHVARAGGVGGSEVTSLLVWAFGEGTARESAERLGKRKLLMLPPDSPNEDTARGNFLEPFVREVYEKRLTREGRNWRRREDLRSIVEAGPHPDMPWLRASLDGLYEIDGKLVLPDFKAPSESSLDGYLRHGDYDDYRAQLNHYHAVASARGVQVDALHLVFFDYRRAGTEGVAVRDIAIDLEMQSRIAAAADDFWNGYVVNGLVPRGDRERLLRHPDVPRDVEEAAARAVSAKIVLERATDIFEDSRKIVTRWVEGAGRLGDGVLPLGSFAEDARGFLEVRGKETFDIERAVARLLELGRSPEEVEELRGEPGYDSKKLAATWEALQAAGKAALEADVLPADVSKKLAKALGRSVGKETGDYDEELVRSALESLGELPHDFVVECVSTNLPRGKAPDLLERKEIVGSAAEALIDSLVPCEHGAEESHEEIPAGPLPGP
jgi:predicted phage-related endonuclease